MEFSKFNIHTSLDIVPPVKPQPVEVIYLTRGASGYLTFDLFDKVYTFDDLEQLTVLFKQDKTVKVFEMIEYLDPEDKKQWKLDPHFGYDEGPGYAYVSFYLSAEETASFEPTVPGEFVDYEIVVKLDTDRLLDQKVDATIIEKQRPIIIMDSVYGDVVGRIN